MPVREWQTYAEPVLTSHSHGRAKEKNGIKIISLIAIKGYIAHVYHLDPCTGFWEHLPTLQQQAQKRLICVAKEKWKVEKQEEKAARSVERRDRKAQASSRAW
jgi:hypothetical protein